MEEAVCLGIIRRDNLRLKTQQWDSPRIRSRKESALNGGGGGECAQNTSDFIWCPPSLPTSTLVV